MIEAYREPSVTETIDGFTYTSTKFAAIPSLQLMARVVRLLGARGLQVFISVTAPKAFPSIAAAVDGDAFLLAAEALASKIIDDPSLPYDLLANTKIAKTRAGASGRVQQFLDSHFAGELPHLVSVLQFVCKHNFLGFTIGSLSTSGSHTNPQPETETDAPTG